MLKIIYYISRSFRKLERLACIAAAKKSGLKVGSRTLLIGNQSFGSEPFLITIGDDCLITDGVKFVTHDGAIQVPLIEKGEKIKNVYSKKSTFGSIIVGNNVFIGINSIILPNTQIRDNSIIAAGSVVKGIIPAGSVVGGNPAKLICSTNEYYKKNAARILSLTSKKRESQILGSLR